MTDNTRPAPERYDVPEAMKLLAEEMGGASGRVFQKVGYRWATEASLVAAEDDLLIVAEKALALRRLVVETRKGGNSR